MSLLMKHSRTDETPDERGQEAEKLLAELGVA